VYGVLAVHAAKQQEACALADGVPDMEANLNRMVVGR
jgi:hypothetical protein